MGKMSEYANNQTSEIQATNGLIEHFNKLLGVKEDLINEITSMTSVMKELHMELINVEDILFEIREKLSNNGIEVD